VAEVAGKSCEPAIKSREPAIKSREPAIKSREPAIKSREPSFHGQRRVYVLWRRRRRWWWRRRKGLCLRSNTQKAQREDCNRFVTRLNRKYCKETYALVGPWSPPLRICWCEEEEENDLSRRRRGEEGGLLTRRLSRRRREGEKEGTPR